MLCQMRAVCSNIWSVPHLRTQSRSSSKLWRATSNQCISTQISACYSCCSALFTSTEAFHMAEPLQDLGLHAFLIINNHSLWCCTAVGSPGSLPVTGSQSCPLSLCPALLTQTPGANCTHTHGAASFCPFDAHLSLSIAQPQGPDVATQEDSKQSCEREAGKNRTWEVGIMVWLVPYLWANHLEGLHRKGYKHLGLLPFNPVEGHYHPKWGWVKNLQMSCPGYFWTVVPISALLASLALSHVRVYRSKELLTCLSSDCCAQCPGQRLFI